MFNIVLISPKIPQNTGNIGRTCVALGYNLHIVKPIPFELDDKQIKRAGLDYWPHLSLFVWESLDDFLAANPINERHFFFTTKTDNSYFDASFLPGDFFYFGSEDSGLPLYLMQMRKEGMLTIDMREEFRSLNLSSAVAAVSYEAFRQNKGAFAWVK
jgi:tRNA (cytidine/uridine-2'-O-)-methyltransferase